MVYGQAPFCCVDLPDSTDERLTGMSVGKAQEDCFHSPSDSPPRQLQGALAGAIRLSTLKPASSQI